MTPSLSRKIFHFAVLFFVLWLGNAPDATGLANTGVTRYVAPGGSDMGDCSVATAPCSTLQYAVNQAASGDTILVAQGTYTFPASVDYPCPNWTSAVVCLYNKTLTISGGYSASDWSVADPTANLTVIDGQNAHRGVMVFDYKADTLITLNMQGFTIQNGLAQGPTGYDSSGIGGGMLAQHVVLNLQDMVFRNNRAIGANTTSGAGGVADGAGLRIESAPAGTISLLNNVVFDGNQSYGGVGPERGGVAFGALFIYGSTVVLEDAVFTNNLAQGGDSAGSGLSGGLQADGLGGGVGVMNSFVTLRGVTVTGNQVIGGSASKYGGGGYGGGIFAEGTDNFTSYLTISDAYVADNTALAGNAATPGNAAGGGINTANVAFTMERAQVLTNISTGGSSTSGGGSGIGAGGGIYIFAIRTGVPRATIRNAVFADNLAKQGGGLLHPGNGGAGGVMVHGMDADISHATFDRNRLESPLILGQAMVVQPWQLSSGSLPANVYLSDSIIANHTEGGVDASAIIVWPGSSLTFNRGLFAGNTLDTNASGIPVPPGIIYGLETTLSAATPGFVSAGLPNYNYHLRLDSTAKDQAYGSTVSDDFEGDSRPQGSAADLGVDEYHPLPLSVSLGDGTLYLNWFQAASLLEGGFGFFELLVTCEREASPPDQGVCGQPIYLGTATTLSLTGLTNFANYTLTLFARDRSQSVIASSPAITAAPTDQLLFVPFLLK